jgi:hypothetical protein
MTSSSAAHPSALALHRLQLASLPAEEASSVKAHVDGCTRCRHELEALAADHQHFDRVVFPRTSASIGRPRFWRWALPGAAVAAAAAVLVLWLTPARNAPDGDIATKGAAPPLTLVAAHEGVHITVEDGNTALRAGDSVRFILHPQGLPYALVASVDGAGHPMLYHPFGGSESAAVSAPRVEVPGSITLDDSPGPERVFVLLSRQPLRAADVLNALADLGRQGKSAIRGARRLPVPAERQASVMFEKASR